MQNKLLQLADMSLQVWDRFTSRDIRFDEIDEFGRDLTIMELVRPLFDYLYNDYWKVQASGVTHVPSRGRALIVANHSGSLPYDAAMIHMAIYNKHPKKRMARFLVEDLVQYLPFLGTLINRVGGVRACRENAIRLLEQDELVTVFPEGVKGIGKLYKHRYQLARFGRGGIIRLAIKTRSPIIPCAVIGAEEIHPILWKAQPLAKLFGLPFIPITPTFPWLGPLGMIPLPSRWIIRFGKPIHYDNLPQRTVHDRLKIHTLTEELRNVIRGMVAKGLAERKRQSRS